MPIIVFLPVFAVSGAAIRAAISFAANCATFWLRGYGNAFPLMVFQLADFAKYPSSIFGKGIQFFVTFVVPYAFISYLPAVYLFGKEDWGWTAWFAPLVAAWCVLFARWVFYRGLRRYEGAGN
jgi:ABC-2 type transport system permease protein